MTRGLTSRRSEVSRTAPASARHGPFMPRTGPTEPAALLRNALAARPPDALLTLEEAAVYCDRAPKTLRTIASSGALHVAARGARRRPMFRRADLDAFLASKGGAS